MARKRGHRVPADSGPTRVAKQKKKIISRLNMTEKGCDWCEYLARSTCDSGCEWWDCEL